MKKRLITKSTFRRSASLKANDAKACEHCRKLKVKCSEHKPTCNRCKALGIHCVFPGHDSDSSHSHLPLTKHNLSTLQHEIISDEQSVPPKDWFPPLGHIPPESTPAHEDELIEFIVGPLRAASDTHLSEAEGSWPSGAVSSLGASLSKPTSSSGPLLATIEGNPVTPRTTTVDSSHNVFVCPHIACSRHETTAAFVEYSHLADHLFYIHLEDPPPSVSCGVSLEMVRAIENERTHAAVEESKILPTHGAILDTDTSGGEQHTSAKDPKILVNVGASSATAASRERPHSTFHEVASGPNCYFFSSFGRPPSVHSIASSLSSMKSAAGSFISSWLPGPPTETAEDEAENFTHQIPLSSSSSNDPPHLSSLRVSNEQLNDAMSPASILENAPDKAPTFACQFCSSTFSGVYALRQHMRKRHLKAVELQLKDASGLSSPASPFPGGQFIMGDFDKPITPAEQYSPLQGPPYPCPEPTCKRNKNGFSRKYNLQDHLKRMHGNDFSEILSSLENSRGQNLQGSDNFRSLPGRSTGRRASSVDVISNEQPGDLIEVHPSSRPNEKQMCIEICLYCKRRKMKCDQDWMGCGYCQNRELKCVYGISSSEVSRDTTQLANSIHDAFIGFTGSKSRSSYWDQASKIPRRQPFSDYQHSYDQQIILPQHIKEPAHPHSRSQSDSSSESSLLNFKITRKYSLQGMELWKLYKNLGPLLPNLDRMENMAWRAAAVDSREDKFLHGSERSNTGESKAPITCSNCSTRTTPLWRSNSDGQPLCNTCGLYFRLHKIARPVLLKTDVIEKRSRSSNNSVPVGGSMMRPSNNVSRPKSVTQAPLKTRTGFVQLQAELMQNNEIESLLSLQPRGYNWHWRKGAMTMKLYKQTSRSNTNIKEITTAEPYTGYSGKVSNILQVMCRTVPSWYERAYKNLAMGNGHWSINNNQYSSFSLLVIVDYLNSAFITLETLVNLSKHFLRTMLRLDKPLAKDLKRVRWRCRCGHYVYDDFAELRPGAVARLQHSLHAMYENSQNEQHAHVSVSRLITSICGIFVPSSWKNRKPISPEDGQLPQFQTNDKSDFPKPQSSKSKDVEDLNICLERGRYATVFHPLDLSQVRSDQELFQKMRDSRRNTNGKWRQLFSLRQLITIKFLQFILHKENFVDVQARANAHPIPPHDKLDEYKYKYQPIPPEYVPPIGENHMMHLYHHPECASSTDTHLMALIPKKILSRLAVCPQRGMSIGWGIHFVEGWNADKIVLLVFVLFGLGSLAFALAWSFLEHDIQGAFGVATYITSFLALSICMVQMKIQPTN